MTKLSFKSKLLIDSFVYTKSRKSTTRNLISVTICIIAAIIISLLIATIIGNNPFQILSDLFTKGFVDPWNLVWNIAVLGIGALAFSFAFRAGIFNIGIPGQLLGAGLITLVITNAIDKTGAQLPVGLGPVITLLIAMIAGAAIASFISILKIFLNVNEVVSSILINWIIYFAVRLIIFKYFNPDPNAIFSQSIAFPEQFILVSSQYGGLIPTIIVFILLVIIVVIVNNYTTLGHKILAVGYNKNASKYAGYNYKAINITTLAISGAIVGIMAVILYTAGQTPSIPINKDYDVLPVQGFNCIAVGLIALNNPIAIVPVAFLMGLFNSSSVFLTLPPSFSQVIMGMIILGAATFVILSKYKPWIWIKKKIYGSGAEIEYNDYENKMESLISKMLLRLSDINNDQIEKLYNEYKIEKQTIYSQYKKHLIIFKASKTFYPELEYKNELNKCLANYDQQLINSQKHHLHKLSSMNDDKNNLYNYLIVVHNKLFNMYDKAQLKNFYKRNKNISFFIKYIAIQYQKNKLFSLAIDNSINLGENVNNLSVDLKNIKNENNEILNSLIKNLVSMTELNFKNNRALLKKYIQTNFRDFKLIDKLKIYFGSKKYISENSKKLTISDLNKIINKNDYDKLLLNDIQLQYIINKFAKKYQRLINKYLSKQTNINLKQEKYDAIFQKNKAEIDKWKDNAEKHFNNKTIKYKSFISHNLDSKYQHFLEKSKKLKLNQNDLDILNDWLKKSYQDALNSSSMGGK